MNRSVTKPSVSINSITYLSLFTAILQYYLQRCDNIDQDFGYGVPYQNVPEKCRSNYSMCVFYSKAHNAYAKTITCTIDSRTAISPYYPVYQKSDGTWSNSIEETFKTYLNNNGISNRDLYGGGTLSTAKLITFVELIMIFCVKHTKYKYYKNNLPKSMSETPSTNVTVDYNTKDMDEGLYLIYMTGQQSIPDSTLTKIRQQSKDIVIANDVATLISHIIRIIKANIRYQGFSYTFTGVR